MVLGVFFSTFDEFSQSQSKVLSADQYPLKQRVLINEGVVTNSSDIQPKILAENLPMFDEAFDIKYSDANVN